MYQECEQYLTGLLKAAGAKGTQYTTLEAMTRQDSSYMTGVLLDKTELERMQGRRVRYVTPQGVAMQRVQIWRQVVQYDVVICSGSKAELERVFTAFLALLAAGIEIDGNWTLIEVDPAEWAEKDNSVLRARASVRLPVRFLGGVYKDTPLQQAGEAEIITERRDTDGS